MYSTVKKAMDVLEFLAHSQNPVGVSELARSFGWPKSNVFHLLDTFRQLGYVRKIEETARYELTLKVWELGTEVHSRLTPIKIAAPFMRQLADDIGETVHLSIFQNDHVVYVAHIEGTHPVRAYSRLGGIGPAYCTATGKAMLAYLPQSVVDTVTGKLTAHTPNTIVDRKRFQEELDRVRAKGFATAYEEWRLGVSGVASGIFDSSGQVVAALGISGPADRLAPEWCARTGPHLRDLALAASRELGFEGGPRNAIRKR